MESRILSFERKCYRKLLRIGWTQKVTNEELYRKIHLAQTLLQKVIQRKLRLFGHICRMNDSRKIKTLAFGMMDGSNKRGWPHRCRFFLSLSVKEFLENFSQFIKDMVNNGSSFYGRRCTYVGVWLSVPNVCNSESPILTNYN